MSEMSSNADVSILGSTQNGDAVGLDDNALSFNDSDFYLNMDDVDIGPQIGQGAFSKVYLGRYLGELVAVKKQARREADLEAYLMRELAVLKHFQHENLLQYVGASDAASVEPGGPRHVFIVTELACGGDLLALLLAEEEVGWKLRVSILTDAARALEFLHRKSLIHRDIKSPNILLDSQHRCKIADFGMARQLGANMTVVGTDAYMAPELMFDNPYGTSADMFSFGIVLWETIYRQKAGVDDFMERRMSDHFELDVQALQEDAPPDTSASLVALAAQLVESEPDQRPTAEDTLLWLEDLTDALPNDEEEERQPIDYESLFPLETGERESQRMTRTTELSGRRRGVAAASGIPSASSSPRTPAGAVPIRASSFGSNGGGGFMAGGVNSPLPPGVPKGSANAGRRPTSGVAHPGTGHGGGGPAAEGVLHSGVVREQRAGMKRAKSLQRGELETDRSEDETGVEGEGEGGGTGQGSGNGSRSAGLLHGGIPTGRASHGNIRSDSAAAIAATHNLDGESRTASSLTNDARDKRDSGPEEDYQSCKRYMFVCMQGGMKSGAGGAGAGAGPPGHGQQADHRGNYRNGSALSSSAHGIGRGVRGLGSPHGSMDGGRRRGASGGWSSGPNSPSPSLLKGASHAPITRQGYLYKKGKSGLKNWQKRWFVLEGSKLIWYKDSRSYPREPRGYLELNGCFLVKGSSHRWKILSADTAVEQDDCNREVGAKTAKDMDNWLVSLQEAIESADTGEGPDGVKLPVFKGQKEDLDHHLYYGNNQGQGRTDMTVDAWLESLGLGDLAEAFSAAGYADYLVIQEMGLTDEDFAYIGVKNAAQRKALKMGARGFVEMMLHVDIGGFFNFHSELVYRVDSKWRYLRATTYFEFSDFEDLHKRLKMAMKDTKFSKIMPSLPQRPNNKKVGTTDYARQMARVQQDLNSYMQKLVMLVGTKEPYFTVLCGMLDLLPPDQSRLPVKSDDFFTQMQSRLTQRAGEFNKGGAPPRSSGGGQGQGVGPNGGYPAKPSKLAKPVAMISRHGSLSSSPSFKSLKKSSSKQKSLSKMPSGSGSSFAKPPRVSSTSSQSLGGGDG